MKVKQTAQRIGERGRQMKRNEKDWEKEKRKELEKGKDERKKIITEEEKVRDMMKQEKDCNVKAETLVEEVES